MALLAHRKTLECNTNTLDLVRSLLFKGIKCVRVSDAFAQRDYETDLLESDVKKLEKLYQLGRESFGSKEAHIRELLMEV